MSRRSAGLQAGDRVFHPRWQLEGTVVRVLAPEPGYPDSVGVKFDDTSVETECDIADVEQIAGTGDPTPPSLIAYLPATEEKGGDQ